MAKINPFKAVRATRDKVALVSSRSYDAYTDSELNAQLGFNPFSFLHIISPSFKQNKTISKEQRFAAIKSKYNDFKQEHTYIKEEKPVFYVYQKITLDHNFIGIIAATSTSDYENDVIKKHEKTIEKREVLFKDYLKATGFNAEPVLLTYPDNPAINIIIKKYQKQRAEYEFTTQNHKTHLLWIVDNENDISLIKKEFESIKSLYIADGHHRSASSYLLAKTLQNENKNHQGNEAYNFCLSYLISESNLKITAFNRLIKTLNNLTVEEFLERLNKRFKVTKLDEKTKVPSKCHAFTMYLEKNTYLLEFKSTNYIFKSSLHELDVHLLNKHILKNILGIKDARTSKKIVYLESRKGERLLRKKVKNNKFKVAFSLFPVSVHQMKKIADDGLTMPPKSTYILPKLRSGLTVYEF